MDNHPIPQDVTGFQFKLIGSMTLKQFGYIAAGGIIAFLFFTIGKNNLIKFPMMILFGGTGAAVAFLPFEGRPLDVMIVNFFRALFSPNQYMYQKMGGHLAISTLHLHQAPRIDPKHPQAPDEGPKQSKHAQEEAKKNQQLQAYLRTMHPSEQNELDKKEEARMQSLYPSTTPQQVVQPIMQGQQIIQPIQPVMQQPAPVQYQQINPQPQPVPVVAPLPQPVTTQKAETVVSQLNNISVQKKQLEEDLISLKQELNTQRQQSVPTTTTPTVQTTTPAAPTPQATSTLQVQVPQQQVVQTPVATQQSVASTPAVIAPQLQPIAPAPVITAPQPVPLQTQPFAQPIPAPAQSSQRPSMLTGLSPNASPAARTARPTTFARKLSQSMATNAGLPSVSDNPNIVVGLVKDSRGNALANILVEIKDKDGSPIRAFKTNLLGQFASATPLGNGVYTIEFEDPNGKHAITPIQVEAKGEIMMPIEVTTVDDREILRQQLFG